MAVLTEPAWKSAREVSWTTDYAGRDTGIATRARFAWADDALFALFELDGAGLFTDTSKPVELEHDTLYQERLRGDLLGAGSEQPQALL